MSAEKMAEGDAKIAQALEAGDFDAACALLGRWMSPEGRRRLHANVSEELERRSAEDFAWLYRSQRNQVQAQLMRDLLDRWLGDARRSEHARAILERVAAECPRDEAIRQLRTRRDLASLAELQTRALDPSVAFPDPTVFALVRRGEVSWLYERARALQLSRRVLVALAGALAQHGADPRAVVELAFELDDGTLLAAVLEHFDVGPAVVGEALERGDPAVHAAAMRHAHCLPDPLTALRAGLRHEHVAVRRAALRALLERPDPAALPDVRRLVDDPDRWDERYNPDPVASLAQDFLRRFGE